MVLPSSSSRWNAAVTTAVDRLLPAVIVVVASVWTVMASKKCIERQDDDGWVVFAKGRRSDVVMGRLHFFGNGS
jgi:hypothetical protein